MYYLVNAITTAAMVTKRKTNYMLSSWLLPCLQRIH